MKKNYTNDLLQDNTKFALSVLGLDVNPEIIKTFGLNSMRNLNKFENLELTEIDGLKIINNSLGYMICEIIDKIENKNLIGVCMDTCHLNDAGYDITDFDKILEEFDKIIGLKYLKCIHINDSKNPRDSHKDRHENLGFGTIGFDNLLKIIYHDKLNKQKTRISAA